MKKQFAFILLILFSACSQENELPKGILPINKMKLVIWDMSLAGNMASDKYMRSVDSQRIMATGLYQKVFSLHKTDKATFYKSMAYYEAHPPVLQTLFDSVNAYGMREKANLYQKNPNIK